MLNRIFIILVILFSFNSNAQDNYLAEGEFWAAEEDSGKFVKQQLKTSALKDSLNKFFNQMELNSSVFWQTLERKLDEDLEAKKNYYDRKISESREQQKFDDVLKYESKWRKVRLSYLSNYLEKKRLYLSFSSGPITSSVVNPQLRMAKFKVNLNRQMVKRLYFEVTKSNSNRKYQNLLVTFKITNGNKEIPVSELADNMGPIREAVLKKWVSWFEREYKDIFNNFIVTTDVHERTLNKYIFSPPGSVNEVDMSMVSEKVEEGEESPEEANGEVNVTQNEEQISAWENAETENSELASQINPPMQNEMNLFKDSQWVLIQLSIDDFEVDDVFKRMAMKLRGGQLFFDLNGREVIHSQDFDESTVKYEFENVEEFVSNFGTHLYNLPLSGFRQGKNIFTKAPQINNQAVLTIQNIQNPEQIIGISDFLNLGGSSVNLKVSNFDIVDSGAKITLNYFGDLENLKAKFSEWENKQIIPNNKWHFNSREGELSVVLENQLEGTENQDQTGEKL